MKYTVTKKDILHSAIGGGLSFLAMVFLSSLMNIALQRILMSLGILGVTVFEPFAIAKAAIIFALVYLICGFLGGLYTGYYAERGLKITLPITGGIGFFAFLLLLFFYGKLNSDINYLEMIILPFLGNVIGAYLGGYTVNWPSETEEEEEAEEEFTLDLEQQES